MKLDGIEVFGIAAKAAGAGVMTALNLSLPVLVGSVIGAGFSFYWDKEHRPKTFFGAVYAMGAMATAGVVATYILPKLPLLSMLANVEAWALATGISMFANLLLVYARRRYMPARTEEG